MICFQLFITIDCTTGYPHHFHRATGWRRKARPHFSQLSTQPVLRRFLHVTWGSGGQAVNSPG